MPEASQKMNMVSDAVRDETKATLAANGATEVFPEPRPQLGLKARVRGLWWKKRCDREGRYTTEA